MGILRRSSNCELNTDKNNPIKTIFSSISPRAYKTTKKKNQIQINTKTIRIRKALENRTNMEDDRVTILEAQLSQAKLIAEEADKKYEEVAKKFHQTSIHFVGQMIGNSIGFTQLG